MNVAADLNEILMRVLKYVVEGLVVGLAVWLAARGRLNAVEIIMVGLTAAATFAVLDMYTPGVAMSARVGTGLGIGANIANFPMMH